jgi:hypothetical protein
MEKHTHKITIFQNIQDTSTPFFVDVNLIFKRIKEGKSLELIKKIRNTKDKTKRNELKKGLPAICFSGEFNKRKDASLVKHSGLICLDFDNFDTASSLSKKRKELQEDKHSMAVFTSPSGNGLKVIVKIPGDEDNHRNYFLSLEDYYDCEYFDTTCKNISRVCYESYDPDIYVNPKSAEWKKIIEDSHEHINKNSGRVTIKVDDQDEIIRRLTMWWQKNYGMNEGERNNNAYILASAFNDFGVNKDLASYILRRFRMKGFPESEITSVIDSAYDKVHNFNSKFFEDKDRVNSVRDKIRAGVSKKEIRSQLVDAGVEGDVADSVIAEKENESNTLKFWNKNDRGVVSVIHFMFKAFLHDLGYYRYYPDGGNNFIFIKVKSNIVDNATEENIKDDVLKHLEQLDDLSIYNYFADKTRFFKEDFLTMLDSKNVPFLHDTKEECYIYYSNCAVKVSKGDVSVIQYENLGGYVWNDQIICREFMLCDSTNCDYKTFLANICNKDEDRINSVRSTIGFLLHGHKDKSFCPAVIVNDEVISDNPEGGTGKGLLIQGISEMKKNIVINGKEFSFDKSFAYQLVSADTQVLTFDDVRKNFNFENLFSVITEGITLEKKNKDAIKIPYEMSPKIVITTNYAIKGKGSSFERRKWELELTRHYHSGFTPYDDFNRLLFDDWDTDEWCRFDNYMINNIKYYMNKGFVKSKFKNLTTRKFIAETNHDFYEWVTDDDNLVIGRSYYKSDLYNDFVTEYPDYSRKLSRKMFYKWIKSYSYYTTKVEPIQGKDSTGRYIIIEYPKDEQLGLDI